MKRLLEDSCAVGALWVVSLCGLLSASPALAGGLYLSEFGTPAMGAAGAGAEALAEDASTALPHHNPAGMTQLEEGKHVLLGAGVAYGDVEFDPDSDTPVAGGDGGNQAGFAPLIGSFYSQSLTEKVRLGASIFSVSGSVLDPDNDWAGRFQLQKISLFTLGINGSVAYQVNDWLSVAAGGTILYGEIDPLSVALPNPGPDDGRVKIRNADDWAGGWNAAILLTPRPGTKIGLIYNSKLELDLSGDIRTQNFGSFALDLDIPLVQMARLGFSQELGHDFTLLGTVGWEDWSRFDNLPLSVRQANVTLETGWHDTFRFALGLRHQWNERWMLQGGVTYDTSPVSSSNRVASLPLDRQIRAAIGAQYAWSDTVNVGGAFEFVNLGRGRINNSLLKGDFDQNNLFVLAFNVSWKSPAGG
jgi:long-chain fatty acid transport protein